MAFGASSRHPNIKYMGNIAAGASSNAIPIPFQSYINVTFFVYPGTSTVALQASPDGTGNWITLTGASAIAANTVVSFTAPLPYVRYSVTGGSTADCYVVFSDNL